MSLAVVPAVQPPFVVSLVLCPDCARRATADDPTPATFPARIPVARASRPAPPDDEATWEDAEWC